MAWWTLSNLRTLLTTETDTDSGVTEETYSQIRENIECLIMSLLDTGDSGSATANPPNDNTGVLTDSGGGYDADEHNGRTLLITSGLAIGNLYTIDDTTATTLVCTGDNLYSDGVRSADTYKILYDIKVNADGHDHDGINSKPVGLEDGQITEAKIATGAVTVNKIGASAVTQAKLKTTTHEQSTIASGWTEKTLTYADYGFECRAKHSAGTSKFKRSDEDSPMDLGLSYVGESVWIKTDAGAGYPAYVIYRYVTSSGESFWVWLLRDKATGKITDADACSDHCGWGQEDPNDRPHPFKNYDPEKHEVLLFNPTVDELREINARKGTKKRGVLQIVLEDYELDETVERGWPSMPVTYDILDDNWEEKWLTGKTVTVAKGVIKPVSYVKLAGIKLKEGQEKE